MIIKSRAILLSILIGLLLPSGCNSTREDGRQRVSNLGSNHHEEKQQVSIQSLKLLYEGAKSEYERRAACLRAIDEGAIRVGTSASTIDEIFATHFGSDLPNTKEPVRRVAIDFSPQIPATPGPDGVVGARDYTGWFMGLQYDQNGIVLNYYLSNVHKGPGVSALPSKEKELLAELNQLYKTANSEHERRVVCLRAIDDGIIHPYGSVSLVDAIFDTHLASNLPTKKEVKGTGIVDFASSTIRATSEKDKARASNGWFMAVEYYQDGNIANYYLTNVHK